MFTKYLSYLIVGTLAFLLVNCAGKNQRVELTPTPTQSIADSITPQQPPSPLLSEKQPEQKDSPYKLLTYRGETGYTGVRQYEIDYDSSQWKLIENFNANPGTPHNERLQNRQDPTCTIGLFSGPMGGHVYIERIELGGRLWELAPGTYRTDQATQTKTALVFYVTRVNDPVAHEIAYFLIVYAPYEPPNKNSCQQQAEQVIATFRIVDSIRQP